MKTSVMIRKQVLICSLGLLLWATGIVILILYTQ
jgi:hypothetical protein